MKQRMRNRIGRIVPAYYLLPAVICLIYDTTIYSGTQLLTAGWHHWDLTGGLERQIPLLPEFTLIYLLFFPFWIGNFLLIGHLGKETAYRFIRADLLAWTVCGILFLVFPTTNIRPQDLGEGIWSGLLELVYRMDPPTNLFPSIHCLASWLCFAVLRRQQEIPRWYRVCCGIMAILICISTVAVRQHVLADVAGGILLAEGAWAAAGALKIPALTARPDK